MEIIVNTETMTVYKLSDNIRIIILKDGSGATVLDTFQNKSIAILPDEFSDLAFGRWMRFTRSSRPAARMMS